MRKRELVGAIARELDLPAKQVEQVIDQVFARIGDELVANKRMEIGGFGVFTAAHYKARKIHIPKTGKTIMIPARALVRFKEAKALRDRLNAKYEIVT